MTYENVPGFLGKVNWKSFDKQNAFKGKIWYLNEECDICLKVTLSKLRPPLIYHFSRIA